MKKQNIYKLLYAISALLVLGFAVHTIVDAVRYDSMLTSFPFYAFIIAHAVEYLVPALIIADARYSNGGSARTKTADCSSR